MKKLKNENGLSLIELLATLALLGIVGTLIFGILINSLNISNEQNEDINSRQKANLISNQLTTLYKKNGDFETETSSDGKLTIYSPNKINSTDTYEVEQVGYSIYVYKPGDKDRTDLNQFTPDNNSDDEMYTIRNVIIEIEKGIDKFTLESTISRLKEN